jgi:hypothetical protein
MKSAIDMDNDLFDLKEELDEVQSLISTCTSSQQLKVLKGIENNVLHEIRNLENKIKSLYFKSR